MTKSFNDDIFFKNFETVGKQKYGEHYELKEEEFEILLKLKIYFAKDVEFAKKLGINLKKGIFLNGPVGVGKSSLMWLFREVLLPDYKFLIKPCAEISLDFSQDGAKTIFQYSRNSFIRNSIPRIICFDDFGLEPQTNFFSNKVNVMREIILARYYYFLSHQMISHFTSNLDADDIERIYGKEVRSRLREMCNLISFSQSHKDKRA